LNSEDRENFFLGLKNYRVKRYRFAEEIKLISHPKKLIVKRPSDNRIKSFSQASGRRFKAAYMQRPDDFKTFITLTFPKSWSTSNENINKLWKRLAKKAAAQGQSYLWVREAHRSGRPHFHILFTGDVVAARIFMGAARSFVYETLDSLERKKANLWMINVRTIKEIVPKSEKLIGYMMKTMVYMAKEKRCEFDDRTGEIIDGFRYWARNYKEEGSEERVYLSDSDIDYLRYQIALCKFFPKTIYFEKGELELSGESDINFPLPW